MIDRMTPNPNPSPELRVAALNDIARVVVKAIEAGSCADIWSSEMLPALNRFAALSPQTLPAPGEVHEFAGMTAGEAIEATRGNDTLMRDLSFAYVAAKNMPGIASVIDRAREALATVAAANDEAFARGVEAAAKVAERWMSPSAELTAPNLPAAIRLLSQGGGKA
ncbi:hypothetical protein C8J45_103322 [Sphingomonas sp. PP-CE-3G-477]|uniref:hypothetical protein n=1 Tax=Sphingomonas sp. PP-CE-3G-477 TaxID=2135660 RepID=UPI000D3965C4|nr:hypothetical protein [Sphingomonas sp. PP-CE-3G-477]PTQ64472.1 hypothetical protein C8J45_103322 [Sphingomonas sp. PP-CE-3G-477]